MHADAHRDQQLAKQAMKAAEALDLELKQFKWKLPRALIRKSEGFEIDRPAIEDIANRRAETGEGHAEAVRALRRASLIEAVDKAQTIGDLKEIIKLHLTIDV